MSHSKRTGSVGVIDCSMIPSTMKIKPLIEQLLREWDLAGKPLAFLIVKKELGY